jgi:putative transposase
VRGIEDALPGRETGRLLLSRTEVSEIGKQLWEDYQAFKSRDLAEYDIAYLFIDGIAERIRPGQRREPVLAAWSFTFDGRKVASPPHGRLEGGRRDGLGVLPGHAGARPRRSAPGAERRRFRHHQGDRGCLLRSARQRCLAGLLKNPGCDGGRFAVGLASGSGTVGFQSGYSKQPRRPEAGIRGRKARMREGRRRAAPG